MEQAVGEGLGHGVVHELEAGVAAHENLGSLAAQQLREQSAGGGDAGHLAVVAGLHAVDDIILRGFEHVKNVHDHVQLVAARLATGHIQVQTQGLLLLIGGPDGGIFRLTLGQAHFGVFHVNSSLQIFEIS